MEKINVLQQFKGSETELVILPKLNRGEILMFMIKSPRNANNYAFHVNVKDAIEFLNSLYMISIDESNPDPKDVNLVPLHGYYHGGMIKYSKYGITISWINWYTYERESFEISIEKEYLSNMVEDMLTKVVTMT